MKRITAIEIYARCRDEIMEPVRQTTLEYHTNKSLEAMGVELERRIADACRVLREVDKEYYWWTGRQIAGLLVKQSAEDKGCGGIPTIVPCVRPDFTSRYVWKVYLGVGAWKCDVRCYAGDFDEEHQCLRTVREVDWRAGKKI
jgi:hypothetical protein